MNLRQGAILGVILAIIVIGGGIFFFAQSRQPGQTARRASVEPTSKEALAQRYIPYSSDALAKAEGRTIIFFTASWCPSCRAADQDFKAHFDQVPSDVTILRADYDTETALKQKYNITSQDTFVQVDKQGNSVTQWNSGGQGVNTLLNNIK